LPPADETRRRLLDAAGSVFADKGFASATVREICQLADANIAAVNYHFGDKEKLYIETVRQAQCAQMEFAPLPEWPPNTPAEIRLKDFIRTFLVRTLESERPSWHRALMLREMAHPTSACREIVQDSIRPMAEVLGEIIGELLPAELDLPQRHLIGFSIVGQCLFHYVHRPITIELVGPEEFESYSIDVLTEHIFRFSLASLRSYVSDMADFSSKEAVP
jgi:AcrR family transcriptional regulator